MLGDRPACFESGRARLRELYVKMMLQGRVRFCSTKSLLYLRSGPFHRLFMRLAVDRPVAWGREKSDEAPSQQKKRGASINAL